tara:strand:- start:225 stop:464 length:240 start_codon:yes stop_codon:yes gene_type:complete
MKIKKLGSNKMTLSFDKYEILVSYETPVACYYNNGKCIRTKENHSRTTQKQITQYFDWVKDKSTIKKVDQSFLNNLLGA